MSEKHSILIVEDDQDLRGIYKLGFEVEGFNVVEAVDGEDATQKVFNGGIDIVLLDLMLPKKSGQDVLKEIKENESTRDIPVVIFTALSYGKEKQMLEKFGFSAYLVKSQTSLDDAVSTVRQILVSEDKGEPKV